MKTQILLVLVGLVLPAAAVEPHKTPSRTRSASSRETQVLEVGASGKLSEEKLGRIMRSEERRHAIEIELDTGNAQEPIDIPIEFESETETETETEESADETESETESTTLKYVAQNMIYTPTGGRCAPLNREPLADICAQEASSICGSRKIVNTGCGFSKLEGVLVAGISMPLNGVCVCTTPVDNKTKQGGCAEPTCVAGLDPGCSTSNYCFNGRGCLTTPSTGYECWHVCNKNHSISDYGAWSDVVEYIRTSKDNLCGRFNPQPFKLISALEQSSVEENSTVAQAITEVSTATESEKTAGNRMNLEAEHEKESVSEDFDSAWRPAAALEVESDVQEMSNEDANLANPTGPMQYTLNTSCSPDFDDPLADICEEAASMICGKRLIVPGGCGFPGKQINIKVSDLPDMAPTYDAPNGIPWPTTVSGACVRASKNMNNNTVIEPTCIPARRYSRIVGTGKTARMVRGCGAQYQCNAYGNIGGCISEPSVGYQCWHVCSPNHDPGTYGDWSVFVHFLRDNHYCDHFTTSQMVLVDDDDDSSNQQDPPPYVKSTTPSPPANSAAAGQSSDSNSNSPTVAVGGLRTASWR